MWILYICPIFAILPVLAWWRWKWPGVVFTLLFEFTAMFVNYSLNPSRGHGTQGLHDFFLMVVPSFAAVVGVLVTTLLAIWVHFRNR